MADLDEVSFAASDDDPSVPVTRVASQGARRPKRDWAGYAIVALVALLVGGGVAAAVTMSASGRGAPARVFVRSDSAFPPGNCTEQLTMTAADGHMSGCISYAYGPTDTIEVRYVEASYKSASGEAAPYFTFAFRNPASGKVDYQFAAKEVEANAVRSDSTGPMMPAASSGLRSVRPGDVLDITLHAENTTHALIFDVATMSLSLNRQGRICPHPGSSFGNSWGHGIPAC
jgi:hypothetical protein